MAPVSLNLHTLKAFFSFGGRGLESYTVGSPKQPSLKENTVCSFSFGTTAFSTSIEGNGTGWYMMRTD